jgi:hypothetical protein
MTSRREYVSHCESLWKGTLQTKPKYLSVSSKLKVRLEAREEDEGAHAVLLRSPFAPAGAKNFARPGVAEGDSVELGSSCWPDGAEAVL